ncbi:hypothetical protein FRC06_006676 [Ceratobasidium sp. 370]|nr:hypothetical protein FRC06_006676 [Ceratobasidium sp. 370]
MSSPQNPGVSSAAQDPAVNASQNPSVSALQNQGVNVLPSQNPSLPTAQPQNPASQKIWRGQIGYPLQNREDRPPVQVHFHIVAPRIPDETDHWPNQLSTTSGFKPITREAAEQLYLLPLPFGQLVMDPAHSSTDRLKYAVFHKVITAGYVSLVRLLIILERFRAAHRLQRIFYEFPTDPTNPLPPTPVGSVRGLLFFSTLDARGRLGILFKVFTRRPCSPIIHQGGQPAGPGLKWRWDNGNPGTNGAAAANGANGGGAVPGAGAAPALVPAGVASVGAGLPGVGLGGQPNAGVNNMLGTQAQGAMPGTGLVAGMVPGDGMIPGAGAGARPNPAPVPPNANANPAVGINPGMMQGLNAGGIPGLGSSAMQGLGVGGVPGLNPNNVPGLAQAGAPASLAVNQPRPAMNAVYQMAFARLGVTPAQFVRATPQQKTAIMRQVRRVVVQLDQRRRQAAAAAAADGMAMSGGGGRPPGMGGPGQPGFEQLQAFMRQQ